MGHGREVRRVRLDEQALPGDLREDRTDVVGLREGDHARDAEVVAARHELARHLGAPGEGVEVADEAGELRTTEQTRHLRARLPVVDHGRESQLDRQAELFEQHPLLRLVGRMVVIEVEPALSHRDGLGVREQFAQPLDIAVAPARRFVRMHAERAPDSGLRLAEAQDLLRLVEPDPRDEETLDAARPRAVESGRTLLGRQGLQVTVGIDEHGRAGPRDARAQALERAT